MNLKDIQSQIEKKAEDQAKKDFQEALIKAGNILAPFFKCNAATPEQRAHAKSVASAMFVTDYNNLAFNNTISPPSGYVFTKKAEAVTNFIDKITNLTEELEEIREIAEEASNV